MSQITLKHLYLVMIFTDPSTNCFEALNDVHRAVRLLRIMDVVGGE